MKTNEALEICEQLIEDTKDSLKDVTNPELTANIINNRYLAFTALKTLIEQYKNLTEETTPCASVPDEDKILMAKDAANISSQVNYPEIELKQLKDIMYQIAAAASEGKEELRYKEAILPANIDRLEKYGYDIDDTGCIFESCIISWRRAVNEK